MTRNVDERNNENEILDVIYISRWKHYLHEHYHDI